MKKLCVVLFLVLLGHTTPRFGVVFQVETTYHSGSGSRAQSSQMSVEGSMLKMEILPGEDAEPGAPNDEVIFRGNRREMVVVDHRNEAYMVIDEAAIEEIGRQLQQAKRQMDEITKNLTKEQREALERARKQGVSVPGMPGEPATRAPSEFKNTGERATKQGYPCVRYDVFRDGQKIRELWVTDAKNIKGGQDVIDVFKEMADFYADLLESFGEMVGSEGGFFGAEGDPFESFTKIDGFPVVTRSFEGGDLESETVLESVTERDLDPDAFEPPKGYRLRTMGPQ
ncbi:MAG: hypothetical protein ACE5G0_14495 [Rhodothermales bacterium]